MRGRFAALPVGTRGRSAKKSPARAGSTREALGWVQRNLQTGDANHLASEWKYLFQTVVLYKARFLFFFFPLPGLLEGSCRAAELCRDVLYPRAAFIDVLVLNSVRGSGARGEGWRGLGINIAKQPAEG